jgi:hypothetical protein
MPTPFGRSTIIAAALALLLLVPALPRPTPARASSFPDVGPTSSWAIAVQRLTSLGIVRGYHDGTLVSADQLLRAQAAATLVRAAGWSTATPIRDYADRGDIDTELWRAVRLLADREVARGFPDGRFLPREGLTRQEALSFIARLMIALGAWEATPTGGPFGDVAEAHAGDVATYVRYVGGVPQAAAPTLGTERAADRCWYAETFWDAVSQLDNYRDAGAGGS